MLSRFSLQSVSLQSVSAFSLAAVVVLPLLGALGGCSDDKPATGCQDSQCLSGNKCVDDGKATSCRLLCTKQSDCPDKFHCTVNPKGDKTYCAADEGDAARINPKKQGQWGYTCNPSGGMDNNPDCDVDQSFWCYGRNPTDAASFCTQYQCKSDADCKGGYWCATVNLEPSVRRVKRSVKETTTVCLPRDYCAPCKNDVDCPTREGQPQYCVPGEDGQKFCTVECANDGNCQQDASCVEEGSRTVCKPRAGTCKGDGTFCSPCYSDADCQGDGVCVTSAYSRERFCAPKSAKNCAVVNDALVSECPETPKLDGIVGTSCQTSRDDVDIPKDYCFPFVQYGKSKDNVIPGCWTKQRSTK